MSTNEQYCGYIAKDKILPWLEERVKEYSKKNLTNGGMDAGYIIAIMTIKSQIEEGLFDWQRGSE
jgi:hypothetical protein